MDQAAGDAIALMRSVMQLGAVISLLVGLSPMAWGQVRVKWLMTSLVSCVLFGVMSLTLSLFGSGEPGDAAAPAAPAAEIDWRLTGIVAFSVIVCTSLSMAGVWMANRIAARRRNAARLRRERLDAADPATVARTQAPDMVAEVDLALSRIVRLRAIGARIGNQQDADSLALVDGRLPELMERYLAAAEASTPEETADLARTALRSVVEIGRVAEDARLRIAVALGDDLRTESRYIEMRSGAAAGDLRTDA